MLNLGNRNAEICVIGRCTFNSSIGQMTYGLCEMLSRYFPVAVCPTEPSLRKLDRILMPNGRIIPARRDLDKMKVTIFTDILWNGSKDTNYWLVPGVGLRICYVVFDSDMLPQEWVDIIERHFDLVLVPAPHMLDLLKSTGLSKPVMSLPIPLDLYDALEMPMKHTAIGPVRLGCISSFHPRKGHIALLDAFSRAFNDSKNVQLHIHSNLGFGQHFQEVEQYRQTLNLTNVVLTTHEMTNHDKLSFLNNLDIYTHFSSGESYSIGLREALALGKSAVISDVGGHRDFHGVPGVIFVPADQKRVARYPEIDNRQFGMQFGIDPRTAANALVEAVKAVRDGSAEHGMHSRRKAASAYSMSRLGATFEQLFNPTCVNFRLPDPLQIAQKTPPSFRKVITDKLGPAGEAFSHIRNRIVPMHDGGFFSIFNTFMTHLVWDVREPRCQRVLPDWDVGRLLARMGNINPTSFCYGLPEDGNIWCKLFEPLFGLTPEQMDDAKFIYRHATLPDQQFNELREPNLTYIHAYKLYHTTDFRFWRQQYHRLLQQHVKPLPHLQRTIDEFVAKHFRRPFMIAAHVRHPSHTVEQPDKKIAFTEDYINEIYTLIARHNIDRTSDHWGIFLATDQQHVVRAFEVEFGSRVCYYPDVVRTTDQDDRVYNSLSEADKNKDGHQLQHLLAARRNWSTKYAEEIIIDAYTMACCNALLHVVSNVSTAVSYINPNIEMVFCAPKTQANAMAA